MKKFLAAVAALGLLAGCENISPIEVALDSPAILNGTFDGQAREILPSGEAAPVPVVVQVSAQRVSETNYTFSGSMTLKGETYSLTGEGQGHFGATIRAQYSPVPPPTFAWTALVRRGDVQAGSVSAVNYPRWDGRHTGILSFGGDTQRFVIELVKRR